MNDSIGVGDIGCNRRVHIALVSMLSVSAIATLPIIDIARIQNQMEGATIEWRDLSPFSGAVIQDREPPKSSSVVRVRDSLFLVASIIWLVWIYQRVKNLAALNAEGLRFSPGHAVLAWLMPLYNLIAPFVLLDELWRASDPRGATSKPSTDWKRMPHDAAVWLAGVAWLVTAVRIGTSVSIDNPPLSSVREIAFLVGSVLAIFIAIRIEEAQLTKAGQILKMRTLETAELARNSQATRQ